MMSSSYNHSVQDGKGQADNIDSHHGESGGIHSSKFYVARNVTGVKWGVYLVRIIPGIVRYVVSNYGDPCCPQRMGLWDPFQTA